jgi:two-component system chemotaxis response regulator CheB
MIRVLIVDDSAVVRQVLSQEFSKYADIKVIGTASDPYIARDMIVSDKPDVLVLDVEMPRMDGISFLAKLMKYYPLPVVILSSLTPKNSELAIRALEIGAVEVIQKPGSQYSAPDNMKVIVRAIRVAASARPHQNPSTLAADRSERPVSISYQLKTTHKIIAIGASTGGTKAIETVLTGFPATAPGTVIVQHMPKYFTSSFAERLNQICKVEVREAKNNDRVVPGVVLIAPGDQHMVLGRSGAEYLVQIKDGPPVHHQRPSVDVLFQAVAKNAGKNAIGVILTGMGADGAKGLLDMRQMGAYTIAQDEKSCVVFGMPREAIKLGGAQDIVALDNVAATIFDFLRRDGEN